MLSDFRRLDYESIIGNLHMGLIAMRSQERTSSMVFRSSRGAIALMVETAR